MSDDAELLMFLYDAKEFKPITECYVVRWTKEGLMSDLDQMYNLRVMFTVSFNYKWKFQNYGIKEVRVLCVFPVLAHCVTYKVFIFIIV